MADREAPPQTSPQAIPVERGGRDLTRGPIMRTLLAFALPTLGANILQSLNASVNAVWVGRFLGERALAATSNANLVLFLMLSAVFGFGMAATILVGQHVGRRDVEGARRVMGTAMGVFAIGSAVVAAAGWALSPAILRLLATPAPALPYAEAYLRVIFLGLPASFLAVVLSMGLRGVGDSTTPFLLMILTVLLDGGLNPLLIRGIGPFPELGIAGSALATAIASYATLIGFVVVIYARDLPIRLRGAELRWLSPDPAILRTVLAKGTPMGLQMFVLTGSGLAMIGLVNHHGVVVTAAYGVTTQLWTYVQMPALAIGAAVSAMVAQNIGAGEWSRVDRVTRAGVVANLVLTGGLLAALTLADRAVLALFLGSADAAIAIAAHINLVAGWSFVLFGVTIVIFGTVRANGAVTAPLVILAIALFPVRLGIAYAGSARFGVEAIWWALPLGSIASLAMSLAYYRFGRWREARMEGAAVPLADVARHPAG